MCRKRKSGDKESRLALILLVTALIDLVSSLVELIGKLIEQYNGEQSPYLKIILLLPVVNTIQTKGETTIKTISMTISIIAYIAIIAVLIAHGKHAQERENPPKLTVSAGLYYGRSDRT
ncbi:MAG: hypothetical protein IIZ19_01750 [Clostridia bacterium]|nr:hypothetical protein [Clostridia bacterium]